ncbi:MAG: hypothetical protein WA020_06990 [Candidatus Acidiferrales bacterium]
MSLREFTRMVIGVALLLAPRAVLAQVTQGQGGTASNIPVLASGLMPPVTPSDAEAPTNVFEGSLLVGANYDDSAVLNAVPREWDVDYSVQPQISFDETRPRIYWGLLYSPGIQISQRLLYRNLFSQKFGGHFVWQTTPHGSLSAQQYYSVTTNPFEDIGSTSPGPIIGPNTTIYIPNVKQTWLMSHALYSYQSSAQTTMGVGGSYELQKFDSIPDSGPTTDLIHTQVASAEAFISHRITPRNQLGVQYGLQVIKFPQADARTTTHTFLVFDQMNLSAQTSITLYGGPEYSLTFNQVALNLGFVIITIPVNATGWSEAGGVMYNWTGNRLAAAINFSRGISYGGGLVGAVELTSGSAKLAWQLTRNWGLTSTIAGADDQLLSVNSGNNDLRSYSAQVGLRRQLWRDVGIRWYYERLNQTGSIDGLSVGNRDIFGVTLEYSFLKPLGG